MKPMFVILLLFFLFLNGFGQQVHTIDTISKNALQSDLSPCQAHDFAAMDSSMLRGLGQKFFNEFHADTSTKRFYFSITVDSLGNIIESDVHKLKGIDETSFYNFFSFLKDHYMFCLFDKTWFTQLNKNRYTYFLSYYPNKNKSLSK
jgi:hypothetical protein